MKFEKLNDSKIKVIISIHDMEQNNVSVQNLFYDFEPSQQLLQNMLQLAEKEVGFKVDDSKLLIEAVLYSEEEYSFTITKLQETSKDISNINSFIFKFKNFDDFIELCTFLNNFLDLNLNEFSKNFSLILYNNTYYLYDSNVENYSVLLDYMKNIFAEFGSNVSSVSEISGILNEYGKIIFDNDALVKCIKSFV